MAPGSIKTYRMWYSNGTRCKVPEDAKVEEVETLRRICNDVAAPKSSEMHGKRSDIPSPRLHHTTIPSGTLERLIRFRGLVYQTAKRISPRSH